MSVNVSTQWLVDGRHSEELQRSLTTASAGSVLLQTTINRVVTSLVLRHHGVTSELDHRPGTGNAAYVNRRTNRTPAGEWLPDTSEPGVVGSTYTQAQFNYCTYVSRGRVTRKLQATGRAYADIMAMEMMFAVEDHADGLENAYVQGNTAANANQCNGLLTLINAVPGQVVANTTATAGAIPSLDKLDEAIDLTVGDMGDKVIFVSQKGSRRINASLQAQQQFNDVVEVQAGFRVRTYDGIPIIKTTQMPDTLTWTGSAITAFTGGATTAAVIVNKRHVWIEDLTSTSVMPLAKTSSQFDQFDIFTDTALVYHNTLGATILGGIN